VKADTQDTSPLPWARDFANEVPDSDRARECSTVCPAECSVERYGPGLPMEATRSRVGGGIVERGGAGAGALLGCAVRDRVLLLSSFLVLFLRFCFLEGAGDGDEAGGESDIFLEGRAGLGARLTESSGLGQDSGRGEKRRSDIYVMSGSAYVSLSPWIMLYLLRGDRFCFWQYSWFYRSFEAVLLNPQPW